MSLGSRFPPSRSLLPSSPPLPPPPPRAPPPPSFNRSCRTLPSPPRSLFLRPRPRPVPFLSATRRRGGDALSSRTPAAAGGEVGKTWSAARLTFAFSLLPGRAGARASPPAGSPRRERVPAATRAAAAARRRRAAGRGRGLGWGGRVEGARAPRATRAPLPSLRLLRLLRPSRVLTQTYSCPLLLFPLLDPAPARRAEAPPTR